MFRPPPGTAAGPAAPPLPPDDPGDDEDPADQDAPDRAGPASASQGTPSLPVVYTADTGGTDLTAPSHGSSTSSCVMWPASLIQLAVLAGIWLVTPDCTGISQARTTALPAASLFLGAWPCLRTLRFSLGLVACAFFLTSYTVEGMQRLDVTLSSHSAYAPAHVDNRAEVLLDSTAWLVSCRAAAALPRPLPTPCRGRVPTLSVPSVPLCDGPPLASVPASAEAHLPSAEPQTLSLRTLLEQALEHPDTQAMFLAATLVETLVEHFSQQPPCCGPSVLPAPAEATDANTHRRPLCLGMLLPVTPFQQECLDLRDSIPPPASQATIDWLDDDMQPLLHDSAVPLSVRTLLVNINKWHDVGQPPMSSLGIFSDGSASGSVADGHPCSWAFTVWATCGEAQFLIGHASAQAAPEGTPYFLGETTQCALTGELLGLCWSLAWIVEFASRFHVPVWHYYDAKSAGEGVFGCCTTPKAADSPYRQLFALATSLRQLAASRVALFHAHVSGHSGSLGNELADQLAKRARRTQDDPWCRCLPEWLSRLSVQRLHPWAWASETSIPDVPTLYAFESEALRLQTAADPPWKPPTAGVRTTLDPSGEVRYTLQIVSFNVLTLLDRKRPAKGQTASDPTSPSKTEVGMRLLGRKALLKDMLSAHSPHIVGLQETRLPESSVQPDAQFHIFNAQADARGHHGCALWLSKTQPYAYKNGKPYYFSAEQVTIVSRSPRHITASLVTPVLKLYLLVLHVPSSFNTDLVVIQQFWHERLAEVERRPEGTDYIVCVDANARLGDVVTRHVGDLAPECEAASGQLFHSFLVRLDAMVPSTFAECHQGPSGTWRAPHGDWHRIDYIAIPATWSAFGLMSRVICEFEVMQLRDDHRPVRLQCLFAKKAPALIYQSVRRHAVRPDKPDNSAAWCRTQLALSAVPRYGWDVDVDVHCERLSEAFCSAGRCATEPSADLPQRPYVPADALGVIRFRRALQHYLRAEKRERDRRLLYIYFAAFCLHHQGETFAPHACNTADQWLWAIDYSEALALALYRWYGLRLRECIAAGRRAYLQGLVTNAAQFSLRQSGDLYRAVRRAFPTAKTARRSAFTPLPALLDSDGEPLRTTAERDECWRKHFSAQEAGIDVTGNEYVEWVQQQRPKLVPAFDLQVVPTLAQTEQVILRLRNGKAAGADGLTAELLKLSAPLSARSFLPVMIKTTMSLREPVSWRGGDLILLAKRAGQAMACDGFRSILIASVAGKVFHRCIRAQLLPLLSESRPDLMAGAVEGIGIEVPALAIRSFQLWQQGLRKPWAVLFFDLQSAYYRVLRQLVVKHTGTDAALLDLLHKLDLPPAAVHELYSKLGSLAALPALNAGEHLQAVISDLLSGTWFRLDKRALLTITARGTRPGDPLADCLFALTLSAYLQSAVARLKAHDLLPALGTSGTRPDWAHAEADHAIGAPSWADDYALPQTGRDAADLLQRVVDSTRLLVTHARSLGMVIKFGNDKTAALVSSIVVRQEHPCILTNAEFPHFLLVRDDVDGAQYRLPVVEAYKHLGGIATSNCSPTPDLYHRFARANGMVKPLSRRFFGSHRFEISVRRALLRALIISKYVHTGASLVLPAAVHQRLWDRQYVSLWRHLCRRTSAETQAHPYQVLHYAKAVAPTLALAHARAAFLSKLFRKGPRVLLTLFFDHWTAHPASSWLQQLQGDVLNVVQYVPTLAHFLPAGSEVASLLDAMSDSPSWWLKQVIQAEKVFLADVAAWISRPAARVVDPSREPDAFTCWECGAAFPVRKHLHVHLARAHKVFSPSRHYTHSPACVACHKWYSTIKLAQQHLKSSPRCLARAVHLVPPLTYAQILDVEAPESQARKKLQKGQWHGFTARPPPVKAPVTFGPRIPTADERLSALEEGDVHLSDLARLFRPSPHDLDWIAFHVSSSSREGPRVHTRRFWQCRPLFHSNS